MRICEKCNIKLDNNDFYCPECGKKTKKEKSAAKFFITIIAIALIIIVVGTNITKFETSNLKIAERPTKLSEQTEEHVIINNIQDIINNQDFDNLKYTLAKDMITPQVYDDIYKLIQSKKLNVKFEVKAKTQYMDNTEFVIYGTVMTRTGQKIHNSRWIFQETNGNMKLLTIVPNLAGIASSNSIERETEARIREIRQNIVLSVKNT